MPRHNYIHTVPMVKELCKKHNLPYISKPLGTAFADIIRYVDIVIFLLNENQSKYMGKCWVCVIGKSGLGIFFKC